MGRARTLLAACALSALSRAAQAGPAPQGARPMPHLPRVLPSPARAQDMGPVDTVQTDHAGRMRTPSLDDTTALHVRWSIPF